MKKTSYQGFVILDRDGVINEDRKNYTKNIDEWSTIEGSLEAIASLKKAGFLVAVFTNQSGVGRGLYTHEDVKLLHQYLQNLLETHCSIKLDAIAYCPHKPDDLCLCRKPETGLIEELCTTLNITQESMPFYVVGDHIRDIQAGLKVGACSFLVQTGKGKSFEKEYQSLYQQSTEKSKKHFGGVFKNLQSVCAHILEKHQ